MGLRLITRVIHKVTILMITSSPNSRGTFKLYSFKSRERPTRPLWTSQQGPRFRV